MKHFVGFLDILGTKDMVARGQFSDLHALDFSGAVVVAAAKFSKARFAVFSDCIVFSLPTDHLLDLPALLSTLFENWISDGMLVRGGLAVGEIRWVDYEIDHEFAQLKNLSFARVYGQALSEAVEIEKSSGPGALVFASDEATELLVQAIPDGGLRLSSNVLRWFKWENLDAWIGTMDIYLEHSESSQAKRHIQATRRSLTLFREQKPNE